MCTCVWCNITKWLQLEHWATPIDVDSDGTPTASEDKDDKGQTPTWCKRSPVKIVQLLQLRRATLVCFTTMGGACHM